MKKSFLAILPIVALAMAAPAQSATGYMNGFLNIGPKWDTITAPDGQTCPKATCTRVKHNGLSQADAARAAGVFMDANDTPDSVLFVYSQSATGANDARAARPNWQGTIIALGPPDKPLNGRSKANGGRPVLDVDGGKITYVTAQGDGITTKSGGINSIHLNGYNNRDFSKETPLSSVTYNGNVEDKVYAPSAPKVTKPKVTLASIISGWKQKAAERKAEREERVAERKAETETKKAESEAKKTTEKSESENEKADDAASIS